MTVPETAMNRAREETDPGMLPSQVRMPSPPGTERRDSMISIEGVSVFYGAKQAIRHVSLEVPERSVTAFIGPSGCGKSTLLRCFNRMNDEIPGCRTEGSIIWKGMDILSREVDPVPLRRRIGMVFQKPNPFPQSIHDNIAYGLRIGGMRDRSEIDALVERSLRHAALWDEVKDRMDESAMGLSGGQQQRLCIARTLAVEPEVILMDEPCSSLDPIATGKIEDLIYHLKRDYTVIIVTHNMQQAARVSGLTGFFYLGELIEFDRTKQVFEAPRQELTERYITGRFG